ncbi:hypothetical protein D3C72_2592240 [compost metagenome]
MRGQPGRAVGHLEVPVHGVERGELVVDRGDQDGVELQDLGFRHGGGAVGYALRWRAS